MKTLKAEISGGQWSYIVNENGNGFRITCEGYGSCTPINVLDKIINNLSKKEFEEYWQRCEKQKDIQD